VIAWTMDDQRDDYRDATEPVRRGWSNDAMFWAVVADCVVTFVATVVALRSLPILPIRK
jgi:hypothetical protein